MENRRSSKDREKTEDTLIIIDMYRRLKRGLSSPDPTLMGRNIRESAVFKMTGLALIALVDLAYIRFLELYEDDKNLCRILFYSFIDTKERPDNECAQELGLSYEEYGDKKRAAAENLSCIFWDEILPEATRNIAED